MAVVFEEYTVDDGSTDVVTATTWLAQSFTIGGTGDNLTFDLSSLELFLADTAPLTGEWIISIQETVPDGKPSGTDISVSTTTLTGITATKTWTNIPMNSVSLKAGGQYAIVIRESGATGVPTIGMDKSPPVYTGGGKSWASADSGATWSDNVNESVLFQVKGGDYAGTLCTLADPINKAGTNASALGTNESLVSDFVRQAEGHINATTRFDWVNAYSGLTDEVKFLLNRVASALAAIDIITFDMSGYTASTSEAETMVNVYREEAEEGLKLLADQEVKAFITGDS